MKRCPYCDWPNTDDADKCCKCRHFLTIESEIKSDYALRAFLLNNQRLFAVMGVFLVIALFFNNPALLTFANPSTGTGSNLTIKTECHNINHNQSCHTNFSYTNNSFNTSQNFSSKSFQMKCEDSVSLFNCTTNISNDIFDGKQNQQSSERLKKFFSFLSVVLFLLIACVVLLDSLTYIQIYKHSKNENKKEATIEVIKDLTIFIFIIPFAFLIIFFISLITEGFGEFLPIGFFIFLVSVYIAEIIAIMYILLRALYSLKGNRNKEYWLSGKCFVAGIILFVAFFWFPIPDAIPFISSMAMALILMSIIALIRPYIEK